MMLRQIRRAIAENWPVVFPLGIFEGEMDLLILPPFYCGASSCAVEPPEGNGSPQRQRVSFRNINFYSPPDALPKNKTPAV